MIEHMQPGARVSRRQWLLLLPLVAWFGIALAEAHPRDWLDRMDDAVENLNYSGTLVHMYGVNTEVLQIVHRVVGGKVTERITSMGGSGREIIRNDEEVTCILPDQKTVLVEVRDSRDRKQSPLTGRLPSATLFDKDLYRLALAGNSSVAGRSVVIILVEPVDTYRYGYRLWLDKKSAMPLKSQLLDDQGKVVEQIMFAEIDITSEIAEAAVRSSVAMESFDWKNSEAAVDQPAVSAHSVWRATRLPPGFRLTVAKTKPMLEPGEPMEHLVYSDGLASVSVFIELGVSADEKGEGLSRIGAANAYTTILDDRLITAMGEVPARTVQLISLSVRPVVASE